MKGFLLYMYCHVHTHTYIYYIGTVIQFIRQYNLSTTGKCKMWKIRHNFSGDMFLISDLDVTLYITLDLLDSLQ